MRTVELCVDVVYNDVLGMNFIGGVGEGAIGTESGSLVRALAGAWG